MHHAIWLWGLFATAGIAWSAKGVLKFPEKGLMCACDLCRNKTCYTDGFCLAQLVREKDGSQARWHSCVDRSQLFPPENPLICLTHQNSREHLSISCCSGYDYCNRDANMSLAEPQTTTSVSMAFSGIDDTWRIVLISSGAFVIIVFLTMIALAVFFCRRRVLMKEKESFREDATRLLEQGQYPGGELASLVGDLTSGSGSGLPLLIQRTIARQVTLVQQVGKGRYGEVYLGRWRGENVAVKVFSTRDENSWKREVEIYQTMMLRHENLLGFIAADNKDNGQVTQLWLITEYHEHGSLYDYLTKSVIDPAAMLRLAFSLAHGLSHLHMDIVGTSALGKPAIAHRDLKSKNVLVKRNGQCAIADLGLAVAFDGRTGAVDIPHNEKVGTVRYLAPEVLENKLVVKNFEALKAVDVYAFALILWEICHRTQFYGPVDDYELPYAKDVPADPTISEMSEIVAVQKRRPTIPNHWSMNEPMHTICRLMKECWYPNPQARLTALRVKKTIAQLVATEDVKL